MSTSNRIECSFIYKMDQELKEKYCTKAEPVLETISSLEDACDNLKRQVSGTKGMINKLLGTYPHVATSLMDCEHQLELERIRLKEIQKQYPLDIVKCLSSIEKPYFSSNSLMTE